MKSTTKATTRKTPQLQPTDTIDSPEEIAELERANESVLGPPIDLADLPEWNEPIGRKRSGPRAGDLAGRSR